MHVINIALYVYGPLDMASEDLSCRLNRSVGLGRRTVNIWYTYACHSGTGGYHVDLLLTWASNVPLQIVGGETT